MVGSDSPASQAQQPLVDDASAPLLGKSTDAGSRDGLIQRCSSKAWACLTFLPRLVWWNGVICMNVSILLYALIWLITREMSFVDISIFQAIFCRSSFGLIMTIILCKVTGVTPIIGERKMYPWLAARGIIGSIAMTFIYATLFLLPVGDACALQLMSTIFVVFFAWVFGWEEGSWMAAVGTVMCTCGAILVSNPPFLHGGHKDWGSQRLMGIGFAMAGAVLAGLTYSLINRIGSGANSMSVTIWFHVPSILIALGPMLVSFPKPVVIFVNAKQGLLLAGMALLGFGGQLLMTRSYQLVRASTGASLQTITAVYCYIFGYLFLGEDVSYFAIGGTALIGLSLVLIAFREKKAKKPKSATVASDPESQIHSDQSESNEGARGKEGSSNDQARD